MGGDRAGAFHHGEPERARWLPGAPSKEKGLSPRSSNQNIQFSKTGEAGVRETADACFFFGKLARLPGQSFRANSGSKMLESILIFWKHFQDFRKTAI